MFGLALLAPATSAAASSPPPAVARLKQLSLEELLAVEVTSVSRQPQPFAVAASALTLLTGDDVRRSGATTLADALRFSTGLHVARIDGRTWGVAARGFNLTASNKLLVMMDGRSLYTPLFSGVLWDVQDTELADIDRIEVVRGPGATMWGANAVNGVISIQTRHASETLGSLVNVGGGTEERFFASARQGIQLSPHAYARVYAKTYHRDDLALPDGRDSNDDMKMWQAGFRSDGASRHGGNAFTLQGDFYRGFLGAFNGVDSRVEGGNLLGRWQHDFTREQVWTTQAYYDRVKRRVPGQFAESRDTFDIDTQITMPIGTDHDLLLAVSARTSADKTGRDGTITFEPPNRDMTVVSGLIQDEITFASGRAGLTVGAKFEDNNSTGFEFQPGLRLAWRSSETQTWWTAVSRAVRTPSRFDDDLRVIVQPPTIIVRGDPGFRSEIMTAYEAGVRARPTEKWAFDANLFIHQYDRLRSQERASEPHVLSVLQNRLNAETYGGEMSVSAQLLRSWRLRATYARLHKRLTFDPGSTDITGGASEGNDPRHLATLVSTWDLPRGWEFDVMARHVGALPAPKVPAYTEVDVRLGWRPHTDWELSLVGQNLLHARHREFGAGGPLSRELERGFYARVTWRR